MKEHRVWPALLADEKNYQRENNGNDRKEGRSGQNNNIQVANKS